VIETASGPIVGVPYSIEINDFGATPGVVMLRLEQAVESLAP